MTGQLTWIFIAICFSLVSAQCADDINSCQNTSNYSNEIEVSKFSNYLTSTNCKDHIKCENWVKKGFCRSKSITTNKKAKLCPKACGLCKKDEIEVPYDIWANSIDKTVDPCEDFYQFACGKYIKANPIKDQSKFEINAALIAPEKYVKKCMENALSNPKPSKSSAVQNFRLYQKKLMDMRVLNKVKTREVIKEIKAFGGCPVFPKSGFNPSNDNLVNRLKRMSHRTGRSYLFNLDLRNAMNISELILFVSPANMIIKSPIGHIDREGNLLPDKKQMLEDYINDLFSIVANDMGSSQTSGTISQASKKVIELETEIFKVAMETRFFDRGMEPFDLDKAINLNDLHHYIPIVNGKEYVISTPQVPSEIRSYLEKNPRIYVSTENVVRAFNKVFANANRETLVNYLCAKYLIDQTFFLDQRFSNAAKKFATKLTGEYTSPSRASESAHILLPMFPLVYDHLFVTECSSLETRRQVSTMVDEIQSSLYEILNSQTWMDADTKKAALLKLSKTKKLIGATDYAYEIEKLDSFYESLQLSPSDSLRQMNRKISIFNSNSKLKNIINPKQLIGTLELRATTVNAFNMPDENRINILAAILNSPNFNEFVPAALNYGAIGVIIGHEFLHSFDTNGVDFDEEGRRRMWWKIDTYSKFRAKSECFIDAYGSEIIKQIGKNVDGRRTITENISDNGGIKAAFRAYKKHLNGRKERHVNGYKEFSNEQNFFISYGITSCNTASDYAYFNYILQDIHSPGEIRTNVVVKNNPDFAKAFNCKVGSKMNPANKCSLW